MKTKTKMLGFTFMLMLLVAFKAQGQSNQSATEIPIFSDENQKVEWLKSHPQPDSNPASDIEVKQSSDPNLSTSEQKAEWLLAHPETPITSDSSVSNKTENVSKTEVVVADISDFPVIIHTGNDAADQADYDARKQKWYAEHSVNGSAITSDGKIHVSKVEFESLTPEKQQSMLNDPTYLIEQ